MAWQPGEAGLLGSPCQARVPPAGSLLVLVVPLLGERVQVEELWLPGREALLQLLGAPPLCLLQHQLLLGGLVLVTLVDGPGDVLPEPVGRACPEPGAWAALSPQQLGLRPSAGRSYVLCSSALCRPAAAVRP